MEIADQSITEEQMQTDFCGMHLCGIISIFVIHIMMSKIPKTFVTKYGLLTTEVILDVVVGYSSLYAITGEFVWIKYIFCLLYVALYAKIGNDYSSCSDKSPKDYFHPFSGYVFFLFLISDSFPPRFFNYEWIYLIIALLLPAITGIVSLHGKPPSSTGSYCSSEEIENATFESVLDAMSGFSKSKVIGITMMALGNTVLFFT
jgi:hypothetical protein